MVSNPYLDLMAIMNFPKWQTPYASVLAYEGNMCDSMESNLGKVNKNTLISLTNNPPFDGYPFH